MGPGDRTKAVLTACSNQENVLPLLPVPPPRRAPDARHQVIYRRHGFVQSSPAVPVVAASPWREGLPTESKPPSAPCETPPPHLAVSNRKRDSSERVTRWRPSLKCVKPREHSQEYSYMDWHSGT